MQMQKVSFLAVVYLCPCFFASYPGQCSWISFCCIAVGNKMEYARDQEGSHEWRVGHMGAGGQITGSVWETLVQC